MSRENVAKGEKKLEVSYCSRYPKIFCLITRQRDLISVIAIFIFLEKYINSL